MNPLKKFVDAPYEAVLARVPDALKTEGFGVLTEIDVKDTLKRKIDVDFRRYKILGACNPPFAHRALTADPEVGLVLPCNVIVYEEGAGTVVQAVDPVAMMGGSENAALTELAKIVHEKLARAIALV